MYCGIYRIAEHFVDIRSLYEEVHNLCRDYACDRPNGGADIKVEITRAQIDFERQKSAAEDLREGRAVVNFSDAYLETLAVYRQIADAMLNYDTVLFHGSVIAVDGIAYLFTAKSGTGKSTHTRLWRQMFGERAVMVNDDKPLLRITDDGVTVYGTPWNGKHGLGRNMAAPLRAVCVLERGKENEIHSVESREIYPMLLQQIYRPADPLAMGKMLALVDRLTSGVKFYRLACNMDPSAARVAYEGMSK